MSLNLTELKARIDRHGAIARVVVVDTKGSAPREAGAAMLVWSTGQIGTIGGGALEYKAAADARQKLESKNVSPQLERLSLGPGLGQCCGGAVTLLTEVFNHKSWSTLHQQSEQNNCLRPLAKNKGDPSAALDRLQKTRIEIAVADGWVAEKLTAATRVVWLYGAGHVGRAIVSTLAPLPQFSIVWLDTSADRFPQHSSNKDGDRLVAQDLATAVAHAPDNGEHLILTYSHSMDLAICDRILSRDFRSAGLIGSPTKWTRFRKRLIEFGHPPETIDRIICPIGDIALGKHPHAIAIGVVAELLRASYQH